MELSNLAEKMAQVVCFACLFGVVIFVKEFISENKIRNKKFHDIKHFIFPPFRDRLSSLSMTSQEVNVKTCDSQLTIRKPLKTKSAAKRSEAKVE